MIWFGTLDWRHLIPTDEGRYAQIAREMLATGDWVVIRYNGYQYFEKPPLHIWATAVIFQIFGLGEWQARLWSGLTSFAGILMVGFTAFKIAGFRGGYLASLMLASSPLWILAGHFNALDMGLAFFMNASLCCLILALLAPAKSKSEHYWMLACWAAMAAAVLSKGLIGIVLPGLVLVVYSLTSRDWQSWARMHWVSGVSLFLFITSPWFFLIAQRHPEFLHFFFIHEHLERFTSEAHRRTAPWHFFIPLIVLGFLPWLSQLYTIKNITLFRPNPDHRFQPLWLCLIWVVTIFLFFSSSQSKLPGYIVPIFPALAIVTGIGFDHVLLRQNTINQPSKIWAYTVVFFIAFFALGFIGIPAIQATGEVYEKESYQIYSYWAGVALTVGVLGSLLAFLKRQHILYSVTIFALTFTTLTLIAGLGHETVGRRLSGYDLAMQAKPLIPEDAPLYSLGLLDHTVPFYLEKNSVMVNFQDELAFGIAQEPERWIPTLEEWLQVWQNPTPQHAFAIMNHALWRELRSQNISMEVIAQDELRVLVRKPLADKVIPTPKKVIHDPNKF